MTTVDWDVNSTSVKEFFDKAKKELDSNLDNHPYKIGIGPQEVAYLKKLQCYTDAIHPNLLRDRVSLEVIVRGCIKFLYDNLIAELSDAEYFEADLSRYLTGSKIAELHNKERCRS